MLVLFAVGFVRMIMGRFVVCILVLMVVYILVICIFVLMVVRILVLMIVCVAVGLHSLDGFLGNGVNAVHQRHYLFVRGIDRIKDCLDPGIGIAADVDEEITFGNRNHIARCRFKRVTFRTRGKQHVEIEVIAADGAQKIILRKMVATAESFVFSWESAVSFEDPAQPVRRRRAGRRRRRNVFLKKCHDTPF